jgi:thiosulfate reductase cytochrome b subunit
MHSLLTKDTSMTALITSTTVPGASAVHPGWLRVTHWLNALSVLLMVASGWRIYNAAPLFDLRFPRELTLGGWLGGALQWHFAVMWLLVANGLLYLTLNLTTGRFARRFFPLRVAAVWRDLAAALQGQLSHADPRHYNAVQRMAYLFVIADLVLLVLSGLGLWKSVQFPLLREVMGGYEGARLVHFFATAALVCFVAIHLVMVALVPQTLLTMIRAHAGERP